MKPTLREQQLRTKALLANGYDLSSRSDKRVVSKSKNSASYARPSDEKFEKEKLRRVAEEEAALLARKTHARKIKEQKLKTDQQRNAPFRNINATTCSPIYVLEESREPVDSLVENVQRPVVLNNFQLNRPPQRYLGGGFKTT